MALRYCPGPRKWSYPSRARVDSTVLDSEAHRSTWSPTLYKELDYVLELELSYLLLIDK